MHMHEGQLKALQYSLETMSLDKEFLDIKGLIFLLWRLNDEEEGAEHRTLRYPGS